MRASNLYAPTLREVPAEAELISHKYMLRAGLMRRSSTGIYTYLPLGLRVLHKIQDIIREEMNKAGSQEVLLPIVQPSELWHKTGRWADYGEEMFRLKDRHGREFCLGPTHEEIVTALVSADVSSYRQLPLRLYQIQNKYRDEIRPRFGVIRSREFIMKDCYSFDQSEKDASISYQAMYDAYSEIFKRCGLNAKPVEADSGAIGGDSTHEFMVLGEAGEDLVVYCPKCDYAANVERAECKAPLKTEEELLEVEEISTPNIATIEELTSFLKVDANKFIKTMIYLADEKPVAVLLRGDHQANEVKIKKVLDCTQLELADPYTIEEVTNAPVGFAGPIGIKVPIIVDYSVASLTNAIAGANKVDTHLANVNLERDYQATKIVDIRQAEVGDECLRCGGIFETARGTEVGQVFKLGTKYSEPLKATFLDEGGKEKPLIMGCYGIGVSRTMAAIIEQHHDEDGICWPVSVAPYEVIIVPVNYKDEEQRKVAEQLYQSLSALGFETVLDDRLERPGVKFKDADLIGFPVRITIGPRQLQEGKVEIHVRTSNEQIPVLISDVEEWVSKFIRS